MNEAVRILHLEDDAADARLIREQLRKSGLDVAITLVDTREAFEAAFSPERFDIVLSDFHMPRFSGHEALALVRSASAQLPFILVTGALGDERAVELLRSGATDFVLKDRLARLAAAIQRALSEHAAHREHEQMQARLAQANRLSKLAAAAARMGTWQIDAVSGKLECSEDFLALIGVNRADWPGTVQALEALVHREDVERLRTLYADASREDRFTEVEFRLVDRAGEVRWMHARGDCAFEPHGGRTAFFGVMMDITERKRIEEALRETDRRKDEFLAMLAHELRNPLAPISNGLAVLRRSSQPPAEAERIHAMLARQMEHMVRLVDDLLDVSRVTLGKIELQRAPVELHTIVQSAIAMSQALIEAAGHRLEVSLPSAPMVVDGDHVRLTQVLANLLNNAAKYTPEGGVIRLSARVLSDHVEISVQDNGIGIPAPMLDRIFDLFTQIDTSYSKERRGLGVGLAMVRKLIEMHGGTVEVRSDGHDQGSGFIVRLPVSAQAAAQSADASHSIAGVPLSGLRVLVVDDNRDAADSLTAILELSGAQTDVAYGGESALDSIAKQPPDVVLLDLGMPDMSGYAVAGRIREEPRYTGMTLIALTGFGLEHDRERARAAGFDHHLVKPPDLDALQELLVSLRARRGS